MTKPVTFNTEGKLVNWIANRTNTNLLLTNASRGEIRYEPSDHPPPKWGSAQITWAHTPDYTPLPASDVGNCVVVHDLSKQSVVPGARYLIRTGSATGNTQSFFVLEGVDGGSVCYGGVALYNLLSHPGAWSYLTPQEPGPFALELNSPYYETVLKISVDYIPRSTGSVGPRGARLIHTFEALQAGASGGESLRGKTSEPVEILRTNVPMRRW